MENSGLLSSFKTKRISLFKKKNLTNKKLAPKFGTLLPKKGGSQSPVMCTWISNSQLDISKVFLSLQIRPKILLRFNEDHGVPVTCQAPIYLDTT